MSQIKQNKACQVHTRGGHTWKDVTQLALIKQVPTSGCTLSGNSREMSKTEVPLSRNSESSGEERKTDNRIFKKRKWPIPLQGRGDFSEESHSNAVLGVASREGLSGEMEWHAKAPLQGVFRKWQQLSMTASWVPVPVIGGGDEVKDTRRDRLQGTLRAIIRSLHLTNDRKSDKITEQHSIWSARKGMRESLLAQAAIIHPD